MINNLKLENKKLQDLMEEVQQKGNLNQTAEQLSIFINKNAGEYNNATMPATDDKRMTKKLELTIV